MDYAAPPFSPDYVLGFFILLPLIATGIVWGINGFPRLRSAFNWHVMLLGILAAWSILSVSWAFWDADTAAGTSIQWVVAVCFAIIISCAAPSPRFVAYALISGAILHGIIGGLQVAAQSDIGLSFIGEFSLDPQRAGASVIQSGEIRWLRPYGLASHPNVYAGYLVVGLLACSESIFSTGRQRYAGLAAAAFILWILLLTFSRGAWLGAAIGGLFILLQQGRALWQTHRRILLLSMSLITTLGGAFFALYGPLILARAGVGTEATEVRSVADRTVYTEVALTAIQEHPLFGVGSGNFPWYASHYFFYRTDSERRGENVHNIYLTIQAELGIIGTVLFFAALIAGIRRYKRQLATTTLLGAVFALLTIGIFDHYPVTIFNFQVLFWGLIGLFARN